MLRLQGQGILQGERIAKGKMSGVPDLLILFTNTVSHKMVISPWGEAKRTASRGQDLFRLSSAALHRLLQDHVGPACLKPCWPAMQHPPWQG